MTNPQRATDTAASDLTAAGYTVGHYPQREAATDLIIRLGDRTVTTLKVIGGGVSDDSVRYLLDEADRFKEERNAQRT